MSAERHGIRLVFVAAAAAAALAATALPAHAAGCRRADAGLRDGATASSPFSSAPRDHSRAIDTLQDPLARASGPRPGDRSMSSAHDSPRRTTSSRVPRSIRIRVVRVPAGVRQTISAAPAANDEDTDGRADADDRAPLPDTATDDSTDDDDDDDGSPPDQDTSDSLERDDTCDRPSDAPEGAHAPVARPLTIRTDSRPAVTRSLHVCAPTPSRC